MSSILVTGGAGFIGSNFVRHVLAHTDDSVTVLDALTYAGSRASLDGLPADRFGFVHGSVCDAALLDAGVVTNRNSIPRDPNGAWYTSGIRFGTPALTTRGFGKDEFDKVAELVVEVLSNTKPGTTKAGGTSKATYVMEAGVSERVRSQSAELLDKHPLYPGLELS